MFEGTISIDANCDVFMTAFHLIPCVTTLDVLLASPENTNEVHVSGYALFRQCMRWSLTQL